ncbi:TPA: DUF1566 domain-containing protein [Vibrio cholerae]
MIKKLFLPLAALTITACQPEPNVALRIDCGEFNDQGVAITLNGKPIGDCPLDIMTHAGQTDISVNKTFADASYLEGSQSLMLAENVNKRVKFDLQQIYGENYHYKKITTIADAREYLKRFPQGQYAQQVSENIEYTFYEKTTDLSGMNEYLNLYPEGRYAPQVAEKKELRYYEGATDISGIEDYIKNYPQGKFISVVKDRQEDYYYSKVSSVVSATKYMELYPNGRYYKEVSDKRESLRLINKRYFDNLDGTVTDKKTGLVWMRCSQGQSWDGKTCNGEAKGYKWHDATKLTHNFAGSTAWRLPTVEELDSLVYCSKGRKPSARPNGEYVRDTNGECLGDNYQRPTINIRAFPNTLGDYYWSSSPHARSSSLAWYVYFGNGDVDDFSKYGYVYHVRLVRAGSNPSTPKPALSSTEQKEPPATVDKYVVNPNGTVYDKETNLTWMRCSVGQEWDGKSCIGQAKKFNWNDSVTMKYSFADYSDWRLPSVEELDSLVECSDGRKKSERPDNRFVLSSNGACLGQKYRQPTIDPQRFPNTLKNGYWSSSKSFTNAGEVWSVNFKHGVVSSGTGSFELPVRLVRVGF